MINTNRVGVMNGEEEWIYVSRIISCYYDYWNCIRNFNSSSRQFTEESKCKKIEYFTTIVGEAADLYVEQYGKSFDETENCFDIPYDSLVEEELIQESDITCLSSEGQQGIVQAIRIPGTNNFTYEYFLTCKDQSTGEIFHESGIAPTGWKGVNGNFNVNIDSAVKVVDGVTSDYTFDTWTRGKVIVTVSSVNPYFYDIDHYEYSLDGSSYVRMTGN